jgi:NitT/TauT family transport system ATP-binding protein/sulfonate transport system ATP-binding protein
MSVEEGDHFMTSKISCQNISKTFETKSGPFEVIRDISLEVKENEFVVLLGPGQCGKTTLLNIIAGLEPPTTGKIFVDEQEVKGPGPDRGVVFQKYALLPWRTVLENVEFGPKIRGVDKKERRELAREYIKLVGLEGFENAYPYELSGGMKQRVGIARAYTNNPKVMLMDEPFGALDAQTRYFMEKEVLRIWEQMKRTVIFVTNNIEEAVYLGDRVIVLSKLPSVVKAEYVIDVPRPREYTHPAFLEMRHLIAEQTELAL